MKDEETKSCLLGALQGGAAEISAAIRAETSTQPPPISAQVPLWGSSLGNDDGACASTLRSHGSTNVMPGFCLSERSLSRKSGQRLIRLRPEFVVLE